MCYSGSIKRSKNYRSFPRANQSLSLTYTSGSGKWGVSCGGAFDTIGMIQNVNSPSVPAGEVMVNWYAQANKSIRNDLILIPFVELY